MYYPYKFVCYDHGQYGIEPCIVVVLVEVNEELVAVGIRTEGWCDHGSLLSLVYDVHAKTVFNITKNTVLINYLNRNV